MARRIVVVGWRRERVLPGRPSPRAVQGPQISVLSKQQLPEAAQSDLQEQTALREIWRDCYGFRPGIALEDLLEPSVIERFVLFRDHGDTTLREIVPALQLKRTFMRLLGTGRLDKADDIGRFLEDVRRRVEARRRGGSRPVRR